MQIKYYRNNISQEIILMKFVKNLHSALWIATQNLSEFSFFIFRQFAICEIYDQSDVTKLSLIECYQKKFPENGT